MRFLSWNVNGIRAAEKKGFLDWLYDESPDVLALQETKAEESNLSEELVSPKGYLSYFGSSKVKKGYSGVGVYSKTEPRSVELLGEERFDCEGRVIVSEYDKFVLINAYFPMTGREERLKYKLDFNDAIFKKMKIINQNGKGVILCGDLNVAHEEIDLARPKENDGHAGFRQEERAWLDEVVSIGYVDTFRHFYPSKTGAYTYWDMKSKARDRGVGWRIDYFFISRDLLPNLKSAFILDYVLGSDHAPCGIELEI